jgi:hypothetical protein
VADHGRVPDVELPQQACQICDVAVETVRLLADGFLGQAKPDHVWNNDPPARSRQRLYEFPIQESPGGIAMQENDGIAGTLIDVVHTPAIDALEFRFVWPFVVDKGSRRHGRRCYIELHRSSPWEPFNSRKENHSLAVQAGQPRNCTETFPSREIENDDFVSSHTIEPGIRPEAQATWFLKPRTVFWNKYPRETPVNIVILADGRHRICHTERMLAAHDDIPVWRDRKVKRTELGVSHLP